MTGARLAIHTNRDAEIAVLDTTLAKVDGAVGHFDKDLAPGLYKIKINRGGALKEQLLELTGAGKTVSLYITDFPAVAPIASIIGNWQRVEDLAQAARRRARGPCLLFLEHVPARLQRAPFAGARAMLWRKASDAVTLGALCRDCATEGDEQWAAVALPVEERGDTWVLELRVGRSVARHAVPLAKDWETRVFLRGLSADGDKRNASTLAGPSCETSVQMARPEQSVVYWDHWETVEVARRALEAGRNIFVDEDLLRSLFQDKFVNPIAGMTGLQLMLDGLAATPREDWPASKLRLIDEVLENLTQLFQPGRRNRLWDDPAWPELPDMTALRLRAGRLRHQIEVREPPLFKASWDALKTAASQDGLTWIGRSLWRSTGDANRLGAYLAWTPRQHSWRKTAARAVESAGETSEAFALEAIVLQPKGAKASIPPADYAALAETYKLPLSIFEGHRPKPDLAPREVGVPLGEPPVPV